MNNCCLTGKIVSDIDFNFIIGKKHKSVIEFKIETPKGAIIEIKAFDDVADYIYRREIEYISVEGCVRTKGYVEAKYVDKL